MPLKDWFSFSSPLQKAIQRGLKNNSLHDELSKLSHYEIKSEADAYAICDLLEKIGADPAAGGKESLDAVITLFQKVTPGDNAAFHIMRDAALPVLAGIVESALTDPVSTNSDDILFALKVVSMYAAPEAVELIVQATASNFKADSYWWHPIFDCYTQNHPFTEMLFEHFSTSLPTGFIAVSLLDAANSALLEGAKFKHPFDSPAGVEQLERWLTDPDEDHYSYAVSTTAALPFITHGRNSLLALAFEHNSPIVRLEAAWAAARAGLDSGIKRLAQACLDVNLSQRAVRYLHELNRADAIPIAAMDEDFQAKATFAQWLAHPNELGKPPDELEILDTRELLWPPTGELTKQRLLKYRVKDTTGLQDDDIGVGLIGSVTFCLFSYKLEQRPPEDCYAIHCCFELSHNNLIEEVTVAPGCTDYDSMWNQCALSGLGSKQIAAVLELSPELKYPQRMVAVAKANRAGVPVWVVIDGPRSRCYPVSEMFTTLGKVVGHLHVGRVLLGFNAEPDRQAWLRPPSAPRPAEQIVNVYERFLDKARSSSKAAENHFGMMGILRRNFTQYAAALATVRTLLPAAGTAAAYETLLAAADPSAPWFDPKLLDSFSALGENFEQYVDALIELHRQSEVPALIERFRGHWEHNLGYGKLGAAALKCGFDRLAEPFFIKLHAQLDEWFRSDSTEMLAEIWLRQGRRDDAHALLIDALKKLVASSGQAPDVDRAHWEDRFQERRTAYLRLFPNSGEPTLRAHGIPSSSLPA